MAKQLKQLYARHVKGDGTLEVRSVKCAQQPNGSDCGIFAAAFLFEWALTSVVTNLELKFDVARMLGHLINCLEQKQVKAFPRMAATRKQGQITTLVI